MIINPIPTLDSVGGKGFQLYQLQKLCPVPDFFAIQFEKADEITDPSAQEKILNYFKRCGFDKVAVRSSATVEDSPSASFAGMFETELNITQDTLVDAIKKVMFSASNKRVEEYCKLNHLEFHLIQMRVIVQKMINSRVSGVCFTRESKLNNLMLLEACFGLGEALVSGIATPDTYRIDRESMQLVSQSIGFQKTMIIGTSTQPPVPVPFHRRNAKKLTGDEVTEVAYACMGVEKHLGYLSADIEWAYEDSSLYLLQVRPFIGLQ